MSIIAAALALGTPTQNGLLDILSGRAWLSDKDDGTVMLANGSSAELELHQRPRCRRAQLEVIQVDGESLLVDRTTGEIRSLDLDTLDVGQSRSAGEGVDLYSPMRTS